jgi:hypothetical protein
MTRNCDDCRKPYEAKKVTSRFCSATCRVRTNRASKRTAKPAPKRVKQPPAPVVAPVEPVAVEPQQWIRRTALTDATLAELVAAGRQNSAAGQKALALAELIDNPPPLTWSSIAGWSREHGAAMAEALRVENVPQAASLADQLKARRDAKRGA